MSSGFDKQPASRPITYQNITYTGGASPSTTVYSAKFGVATQQVRVFSSLAGWCSIDQSTLTVATATQSAATVGSTNIPGTGMFIPASTVTGEYFTVTPGQLFTFASTSTSSGYVSITEMA